MGLALLLLVAPLAATAAPGNEAALLEQLKAARERWQAAGLVDYSFTVSNGCFCLHPLYAGPLRIEVRQGEVQRIFYVGKPWDNYTPGQLIHADTPLAMTVLRLFTEIENRIGILNAAFVQTAYDSRDGHPTLFAYDDPSLEDEQIHIDITDFTPEAPQK